jgi:hypothetical protein
MIGSSFDFDMIGEARLTLMTDLMELAKEIGAWVVTLGLDVGIVTKHYPQPFTPTHQPPTPNPQLSTPNPQPPTRYPQPPTPTRRPVAVRG